MQIKLNTDIAFFWFLPNGKIHLSEENPGPIEVDLNTLTDEEKSIIKIGITTGSLFGVLPIEQPIHKEEAIYIHINHKLTTILNKKIPSIKKEIGLLDNQRELQLLFELEKKGKSRNKILDLINAKLSVIINTVQSSIIEDNSIEVTVSDDELLTKDIVESDEETRIIELNSNNK